jgi:hypothetical protein
MKTFIKATLSVKNIIRFLAAIILVSAGILGPVSHGQVLADDGTAPEIYVSCKRVEISNGDTTPSTSDYTDYGMAAVGGGTVLRLFNIYNSGTAPLHLTGTPVVAIMGENAGDFTLINTMYTTVPLGANLPAMISFHPSAPGLRTAVISIANDDSNENPYTFTIQGTGALNLPEIMVSGNGQEILNYYNGVSQADFTDFGSAAPTVESVTRTFVISNPGSAPLNLTGTPLVAISGSSTAEFVVTAQPVSPIASGGSTSFQITFTPAGTGTRAASVTISNDDSDENPYTFDIRGTGGIYNFWVNYQGTLIANGDTTPSTADHTDFGTVGFNGGAVVHNFYITNSGTLPVTLSASPCVVISGENAVDFTVSRPPTNLINPGIGVIFAITFHPSATGLRRATVSISTNIPVNNLYTFSIQGTGSNPQEINITGNGQEITDGDTTPSLLDFTDFGTATSGGISRTFTISNTGLEPLNLTGWPLVAITGVNAADFTVTTLPVTPIASGGYTTFQITFTPAASGLRNAAVSIPNNDNNENPYNFNIRGFGGGDGEIKITGNGQEITNGDITPNTADYTDLGSADIWYGSTPEANFNISNTGSATLYLTGSTLVNITGPDAADFWIHTPPSSSVAPGGNTYFNLHFNPHSAGLKHATISIANSDADENPHTFSVQALATTAIITITANGQLINNQDYSPSTVDFTDFGTVNIGSEGVTHTFTITNTGNGPLELFEEYPYIGLTGTITDFTVTSIASNIVPAGGSLTFQVVFRPSASGLRSSTLLIVNDRLEQHAFEFGIQGTGSGTTPEINITGNSYQIEDGDTTPNTRDLTDFGSMDVTSGFVSHTFTITNSGTAPLNFTGAPIVTISGANAVDFSVTQLPVFPVATGGSTQFKVAFNPSEKGLRSAEISVASNDVDENPYNFYIQGTGSGAGQDNNAPEIYSATYNASTGVLTVTGGKLVSMPGANNDVDASKITITGESSETYTLTNTADVEISGPTIFTLTLSNTDKTNLNPIMNIAGLVSTGGITYNIGAAEGWMPGTVSSGNTSDLTDNPVTATQIPNPRITSAVYDTYRGTLLVTGTNFKKASGPDIDASKFHLTGNNHSSLNFGETADVDLLTPTTFRIVLADRIKIQLLEIMDKDGDFASDGTAYNLLAEDDWNTGAQNALDIADPDIPVRVTITGPEIDVYVGNLAVADEGSYDFGAHEIDSRTDVVFTIINSGKENLDLPSAIVIDTWFNFHVISEPNVVVLGPGQTTSFTVRFSPIKAGVLTGYLRFNNSDLGESPYNITLTGTGRAKSGTTTPTETSVPGTTSVETVIGDNGRFNDWVFAYSPDNNVEVKIVPGVVALDHSQNSLETISIVPAATPPPVPQTGNLIGGCYNLGPEGASFNPGIEITFIYSAANLPQGVDENSLSLYYYDPASQKWIKLESRVDPTSDFVKATITHFSTYAIMAPKPAVTAPAPSVTPPPATPPPSAILPPHPSVSIATTAPIVTTDSPKIEQTLPVPSSTTDTGLLPPEIPVSSGYTWIWWLAGAAILIAGIVLIVRRKRTL